MIDARDRARNERDDALSAACEAVVQAAMAAWRGRRSWLVGKDERLRLEKSEDAACAALSALEGK